MIAKLLIHPALETRIRAINDVLAGEELKKDHPDVLWIGEREKLGVEAAKKIRQHLSLKPYSAKGRAVVIEAAQDFTHDGQNSLLKILEEPPTEAIILLGADSDRNILPTVLSRMESVTLNEDIPNSPSKGDGGGEGFNSQIEKLLKNSIEERIEYIEKLEDKEAFFHGLLTFFHKNFKSGLDSPEASRSETKYLEFSKELFTAEKWIESNGNPRAILEYLMLKMPSLD